MPVTSHRPQRAKIEQRPIERLSTLVWWLILAALLMVSACSSAPAPAPAATVQPTPRERQSYLATETPPAPSVVLEEANLRAGPGTEFERLGSAEPGEVVRVVGRNAAGDWYQLDTGAWIAAFLVRGAPAGLPVLDAGPGTAAPAGAPTALSAPGAPPAAVPANAAAAQLIRVVDGDTIEALIAGGTETVRYIGIDTPERGQPGYQTASEANAALLGEGWLWLVQDRSNRDRYGRLLRYVYNGEGVMVNRALVAQGWAQPVEYPPDTAYAAELRQDAVAAAQAGLGFWSGWAPDGAAPYALAMGNVNLRAGPGTEFDISAKAANNTPLTVFGRTADGRWLQVRAPDRSGGWVAAGLVALRAPVAGIPVTWNTGSP
jgi:endonuclease YncB( thermonuclease family)